MLLAVLTWIAALLIEGIGTYVSVVGLGAFVGYNVVIMALAASLDFGKIIVATALYKKAKTLPLLLRTYLTPALIVLILFTSAGAAGYLQAAFQTAVVDTKEQTVIITGLKDERERLLKRKAEIDAQIAKVPDNFVTARRQLIETFRVETDHLNRRLVQIDTELPKQQVVQINKNAKAGPIVYVAETFNVTVEQAANWVVIMIIFVFDPLAIALVMLGTHLWEEEMAKRRARRPSSAPFVSASETVEVKREGVRRVDPRDLEPDPTVTDLPQELSAGLNSLLRNEEHRKADAPGEWTLADPLRSADLKKVVTQGVKTTT